MGRFKVKNIEIVAMSDKEYGKHLNDLYKKVKNRKAKKEERIVLTSISDLNKILTPERLRLIRTIKKKNPKSISILAKLLERDRANLQAAREYLIDDDSGDSQKGKVARDMDIVLNFLKARGKRTIRPDERDNILKRIRRWKAHLTV